MLCENKRAKIKFIDSTRRDRSAVAGIVDILEANLERVELSQSYGYAVNCSRGKNIPFQRRSYLVSAAERTEENSFSRKIVLTSTRFGCLSVENVFVFIIFFNRDSVRVLANGVRI